MAGALSAAAVAWALLGSPAATQPAAPQPNAVTESPPIRAGRGGVPSRPATVAGIGSIRGSVVDPDGAAVAGGSITLSCLSPDGTVGPIAGGSQRLGDEGEFEGPACAGTVCVEYRHPAFVRAAPWVAERGDARRFVAAPLSRLWGEVRDGAGDPIANATVVIHDGPRVVSARTSTDADGTFSVAKHQVPPCDPCAEVRGCATGASADGGRPEAPEGGSDAQLEISVRAPGFAPATVRADAGGAGLEPDAPWVVVLSEPAEPIVGTIRDAEGVALPRAFVLARSADDPREQHRADPSDGEFSLASLGPGVYTLRAIQDGVEVATVEAARGGDTVAMVVDDVLRDVVVEIVNDGAPLPDVGVRGGPFGRAVTDSSGQVRAERVVPGTYILRVDGRAAHTDDAHGRATIVVGPGEGDAGGRIRVDLATLDR
ncbi:MAG: carboxypeptidase regulatory-like domain-containing protein [Myxococcota bacterium]